MKKIDLICVGEQKFPGLRELEKKYLQAIGYYVEFTNHSVREGKGDDDPVRLAREGEAMNRHLLRGDFVVALDRQGKQMDSVEFARFVSEKLSYHSGRLVFLIGGFLGISPAVAPIHKSISFSAMTFPHDLFRVIFLEQIYRALTITAGLPYHR